MAYSFKFTQLAICDIDEALDYITDKLQNPGAAKRLYSSIKKEISGICKNPSLFPDCSCYYIDDKNIRHSLVGNYVLIFEICKVEKEIRILRFLYGRMDISHMAITN